MNTLKLAFLTFISLVVSANSLAANIYKWKDKDGIVHYSQNAPSGQQVEVITTKTPKAPLPETGMSNNDSDEADEQTGEDGGKNKKRDPDAPVATKDKASCEQAKTAIIELQKPLVSRDGKIMTIEEKNQVIDEQMQIQKIHCP